MIKTITRDSIGKELFDNIIDDIFEFSRHEHRRGSSFYTQAIYHVDEDSFPDNPELWGYWGSNMATWDDDEGFVNADIYELTRVEKKPKTIVVEEWVPVE